MHKRMIAGSVAACAVAFAGASAFGGKAKSPVYDLRKPAKILGRTPEEWTIEWWNWIYSIPGASNPGLDPTGASGAIAQRGPVWFLCGAFNSASVNRTITIPEGVHLFFPVLNVQFDSIGLAQPLSIDELYEFSRGYMGGVVTDSLAVQVDGQPLGNVAGGRIEADPFVYALPDESLYVSLGIQAPRGIYGPAVSDGFWVMLRPLAPGRHTLAFTGTIGPPVSFTLEVEYTIDVVPVARD